MVTSKTGKRASWGWASLAATALGVGLIAASDLVEFRDRGGARDTLAPAATRADAAESGSSAAPHPPTDGARRQRLLWALLSREIGGRPLGFVR